MFSPTLSTPLLVLRRREVVNDDEKCTVSEMNHNIEKEVESAIICSQFDNLTFHYGTAYQHADRMGLAM
jgi:hypothetical protein